MVGDDLFLEQQFDAISEGLEESEGSDAVGPNAVLHPCGEFAFEEDEVVTDPRYRSDDKEDCDQSGNQIRHKKQPPGVL
jgi:hypothetical protein